MSAQTGIEWCDSTFNPWQGCAKVSPACDHCYAERQTARFKAVEWGAGKPRVRTSPANWKLPDRWNRQAEEFVGCTACNFRGSIDAWATHRDQRLGTGTIHHMAPARRRVFCASLADWLDNEVPIEWLVDLLNLIRRTPNLDWLLLTKRVGNWQKRLMLAEYRTREMGMHELSQWLVRWLACEAPSNAWLGATVVNQAEADRDVPKLLDVPARIRFLSMEPLLGGVTIDPSWITRWPNRQADVNSPHGALDWIIAGGESGPHARPMHPDWVRSLRDQCAAAGVPFLFKQWGEFGEFVNEEHYTHGGEEKHAHAWVDRSTGEHGKVWLVDDDGMWSNWTGNPRSAGIGALHDDIAVVGRHGKKAAGRQIDDREHNGFPA